MPGELVVHAEVVLEGDGREGLVLLLDPHAFLRFFFFFFFFLRAPLVLLQSR